MEAFLAPSRPVNQFHGVYPAIVVDNKDPEGRYRVKVKFPWMMESDAKYVNSADKEEMRSTWCRIASMMAGTVAHGGGNADQHRGAFFLPEVDDEVLVAFMFGSFREPIIIGQLYNGKDKPFWQNKEAKGVQPAGGNAVRGIRSRSGHMISFVDNGEGSTEKIVIQTKVADANVYDQPALGGTTQVAEAKGGNQSVDVPDGSKGGHVISLDMTGGKESILIADKTGKCLIKLDSVSETILIYASKNIIMNAKEEFKIKCKNLTIQTDQATDLDAGSTWKQKSASTMDMEAGGTMTEKAPKIDLNP